MNFNKMVTFLSAAGIFALTSCGGGIKPPFDPVNPGEEITFEQAQAFVNENFYDESEVEAHKKTPESIEMEWDFSKTIDEGGKYIAQAQIMGFLFQYTGKVEKDVQLKDKRFIDDCQAITPTSKQSFSPLPSAKFYLHENSYLTISMEVEYTHEGEVGTMKGFATEDKNGYQTYTETNIDNCYMMGSYDYKGFVNGSMVAKINW